MGKMHDALRKAKHTRHGSRRGAAAQGGAGVASHDAAAETSAAGALRTAFWDGDVDPHLVPLLDPQSMIAEEYRTLRENLRAISPEQPVKVAVVTSAVPTEGKSVSAANLALAMAEDAACRVALVDADLRKPSLHTLLGIDNQHGLSDYLTGGTMLEMVLQRCRLANLWMLPAGRVPPNPTELLGSKRMDDLLSRLRRDFDFVVIDVPPVVSTADPGVLAPRADGVLVVVRMGRTPREVAKHAVDQLGKAHANVLGLLLTGL